MSKSPFSDPKIIRGQAVTASQAIKTLQLDNQELRQKLEAQGLLLAAGQRAIQILMFYTRDQSEIRIPGEADAFGPTDGIEIVKDDGTGEWVVRFHKGEPEPMIQVPGAPPN